MIAIAAIWISLLLVGGGFALDRVLTGAITRNFDAGLEYVLIAMIRSSEIGPDGEVRLLQPLGDQRFLEPYSGLYWQISGEGQDPYQPRSLWVRRRAIADRQDDRQVQYRTRSVQGNGALGRGIAGGARTNQKKTH